MEITAYRGFRGDAKIHAGGVLNKQYKGEHRIWTAEPNALCVHLGEERAVLAAD
jgi:hypothetical protein